MLLGGPVSLGVGWKARDGGVGERRKCTYQLVGNRPVITPCGATQPAGSRELTTLTYVHITDLTTVSVRSTSVYLPDWLSKGGGLYVVELKKKGTYNRTLHFLACTVTRAKYSPSTNRTPIWQRYKGCPLILFM